MKRHDESFLDYKKRVIDPVSASFCSAKWYNATIWLGHGQTTSCHHPPAHNIDVAELEANPSAIHNTKHKKLMRKYMQEGIRPEECEYCWKVEDIEGHSTISDRVYKTDLHSDAEILKASKAPWEEDTLLKTLEISFERTCNFACSYCNPAFSTTWVNDIKKSGPYRNILSDGRGHFTDIAPWAASPKDEDENPYIKAFWRWWESDLADNLEEIRITGGEPLMAASVWKMFDWFKNNQKRARSMRFAMNTNLVPKQELLEKLIDASHHIPHFTVYTSNESIGKHSEYIRDGMIYDEWKDNIERLITEGNLKALNMMMTINSLCLASITEFMDDMFEIKRKHGADYPIMSLNLLRFPSFQSPAILPTHMKDMYRDKLRVWLANKLEQNEKDVTGKKLLLEIEQAQIERLIDYLGNVDTPHRNTAEKELLYNDFKNFYLQYDVRRGKDFRATFPKEFVDFIDSIDVPVPTREEITANKYRRELNVITPSRGNPMTAEEYKQSTGYIPPSGPNPATTEEYDTKVSRGWDTTNDTLGKNV